MTEPAIQVEGLSKRYRLGATQGLSSRLMTLAKGRLPRRDSFWALKDVSFDVPRGEVLGVIGGNGAGKSTLLKILSRITDPTDGRAVVRGRVGSLLEVGTGFHPELTGKENIFLSGAVLGMSRAEVKRHFDEIVDFAGIEKFLQTPVKRYSSGMYVRLAFAVAAHLQPEVLIVDEVLAVGDASFQSRCLGRMSEVAKSGRTVLFVSHNMAAIASLCHRAMVLRDGHVVLVSDPGEAIAEYLPKAESARCDLAARRDREGNGAARVESIEFSGRDGTAVSSLAPMRLQLRVRAMTSPCRGVQLAAILTDVHERAVMTLGTRFSELGSIDVLADEADVACDIESLPLAPGTYTVRVWCGVGGERADDVHRAAELTVSPGEKLARGQAPSPTRHGPAFAAQQWKHQPKQSLPECGSLAA